MAWTAPRTWTAGEFVTASVMNTHVRDNLLETGVAKVTTAGDLVRGSGAGAVARLARSPHGVLRVDDAGAAITWSPLDDILPWIVSIDPYERSAGNTNWNSRGILGTGHIFAQQLSSSGAQNAEVYWYVVLAAGTWKVFLAFDGSTGDQGIYSIRLDDVEVATIDPVAVGGSLYGLHSSVSGIAIATGGKKKVSLVMATKNAASSGYYGRVRNVTWVRTA